MDIGTGDGLFVYKSAQINPQRFFIGIDANRSPLQKISEKIYRRPAKGGLSNVLFVQAAVEDLPTELEGLANEVDVQFPWGSLLRGMAAGDAAVMSQIRRICRANAQLRVMIGLDLDRDVTEWERLGLDPVSLEYVRTVLADRYRVNGFRIVKAEEVSLIDLPALRTSWARRLQTSSRRTVIRIVAQAKAVGEAA